MKRAVVGMYEKWAEDGEFELMGWTVHGCGCPWQACVFTEWEDAITHAIQCPISV